MSSRVPILYFGTPALAAEILNILAQGKNFEIKAVITNPDAPKHRAQKLKPSAVAIQAEMLKIPVLKPHSFSPDILQQVAEYKAAFAIVVAYGKILSNNVLSLFPYGMFNLHFSLLPKYRGASPVQSALLHGEKESGFTVFRLTEKMDNGNVFVQENVSLKEKNAADVFAEMTEKGASALLNFCEDMATEIQQNQKIFSGFPQDESAASYCGKFSKADGEIFPEQESAQEIVQKYNAFFLWPGIFLQDPKTKKRIKLNTIAPVHEAENTANHNAGFFFEQEGRVFLKTQKGIVEIHEAQPEGKKPMNAKNFWNWWNQQ